ncbi:hypothetical protein Pmani_026883 [Petrolisthes manimaculis]|uniref:SHSP domain-containing protein n=1 Tax=Petrolisthes manimaculis TaxID=1843537 RepID=A0AAE1P4Y8_9EUCA|nr:hypothetical protein Pmani_026883 [Petrolisthes manimaculis]
MAPISEVQASNISTNIASSNNMSSCQCGRQAANNIFSFNLPINRRGLFFQDSFFNNSYDHFDNTIRRIMQGWGATNLLTNLQDDAKLRLSNNLSQYRQLRTHNLKEEDQAVTVVSDNSCHKIMMDVHDFVSGDLKVKVVGERQVMVEGRLETNTGDLAMSSNCFRRKFSLPQDTNMEAITSAMSSDGVLTIIAPRSVKQIEDKEIPIRVEGSVKSEAAVNTNQTSLTNTNTTTNATCSCQSNNQTQTTPVKIHTSFNEAQQQQQEHMSQNQTNMQSTTGVNNTVQAHNSCSSSTIKSRNVPINTGRFLPITTKGLFFNDSYFEGIRQDFQNAVNDVLSRWGEGSMLGQACEDTNNRVGNNFSRYRQLRAHNLKVDNQAVNITSDHTSHKIVMDVHDFVKGDVNINLVGEREMVVEGRLETHEGNVAVSSNSFKRRFCLPHDTNIEAISSVMSSDGVLTITVPRMMKQIKKDESIIPIKLEDNQTPTTYTTHKESTVNSEAEKCIQSEHQKRNEATQSISVQQNINSSITNSSPTNVTVSGPAETIISKETMMNNKSENVSQTSVQPQVSSQTKNQTTVSQLASLPVTTRGLFFNDSFFKDTWQDFQDAVKDVVSRWGNFTSTTDHMTSYRSLRAQDLREETQAVKSSEDEHNYKIVLDVLGFTTGGTINVKAVNEREVVVEGQVEKEEGGTKFRKQFHRRFVLPRDIYLESVSSVMSSDGVLTITAPKKPITMRIKEMIIPMSIEEGIHKSESLSKVTEEQGRKHQTSEDRSSFEDNRRSESSEVSTKTSSSVQSSTHQKTAPLSSSISSQEVREHREHIIPVRLEGQDTTTESLQQQHHSATNSNEQQQSYVSSSRLEGQDTTTGSLQQQHHSATNSNEQQQSCVSSSSIDQSKVCQSARSKICQSVKESSMEQQAKSLSSNSEISDNLNLRQENTVTDESYKMCVPITKKGPFFRDSFFEDTRKHFTNAVREVLKNTEESSVHSDELNSYRSLLRRNPKLENQAVHMEEDQYTMKIILDVHDFIGGEVKVAVSEGREMMVKGQAAQEEGSSASNLSFRRVFTLPLHADIKGITSAMSSDGVLTITTPKLQNTSENDTNNREMVTASQSRVDTQGVGTRGWQEKKERHETKESEGCSSQSYSSSYRSQQEFSSNNAF